MTVTVPHENSARIGIGLSIVSSVGCPRRSVPVRQNVTISGSK
jgi:hypothetical protein